MKRERVVEQSEMVVRRKHLQRKGRKLRSNCGAPTVKPFEQATIKLCKNDNKGYF